MAFHVASRSDRCSGPGEQAKVAAIAGPMRWARSHRRASVASSPESMFTWIDAQLDIIRRPSGPHSSKYACMAS